MSTLFVVNNHISVIIAVLLLQDAGHLDAIFSLLSGLQIEKACKIACENKEYRMALLLSQASGDSHVKHLLREQIGEWIKQGVSLPL